MADDRRINLLQDVFDQIARLTVSLSENRPVNPSNNAPASNSVSMELSRRFPSLRMLAGPTSVSPATSSATSNSANRATFSRSSSTRSQASRKRKRTVGKPSNVIYKDLVLIPDPEEEQASTHTARVTLETDGKVIHGFPVDMEWDARSLRRKICDFYESLNM
ncbi:Hypothetical predicted protein [Paramuricea clavata]|uniref:Uncharacterized protein n=1 Tax=Paramuricea clavata TaxID=317549 RepID=A0A7D9I698_PARCT|nr:Hypothetical predicted protein [Paramuricea clavata]